MVADDNVTFAFRDSGGKLLYFELQYEEFSGRTMWSLSNAFTSAFKQLDQVPQFKATAKLGEFLAPGHSHGWCSRQSA